MSITTTAKFTNTNLPSVKSYGQQLLADANLVNWFQADGSSTVLGASPNILSFLDKKGTSTIFTQTTAADQASLVSAQVGNYPAAVFNGTSDAYGVSGGTISAANTFSVVWFGIPNGATSTNQILFADFGTNGSFLAINSSGLADFSQAGATIVESSFVTNGTTPFLIIASYNATKQTINLRVNGVTTTPLAATAVQSGGIASIGGLYPSGQQCFGGKFSDFMFRNDDIFTNPTALDITEKYFTNVYGLTFTPV